MESDSKYLTRTTHGSGAKVITRNDNGTYTFEHMNGDGYPDNAVTLTREQMQTAVSFYNEREIVSIITRSKGNAQ